MVEKLIKFGYLKQQNEEVHDYEVDLSKAKGEFIFILDRSGSMGGRRMNQAKESLKHFLRNLPLDSYFQIISYGSNF